MQVIQVVPEEVCSYWFMSHVSEEKKGVGIYVVEAEPKGSNFALCHPLYRRMKREV